MARPLISLGVFILSVLAIICFAAFLVAPQYIGEGRTLSPLALASWIFGSASVIGFLLIGQRVWWAWYINVFVQVCWVVFWVWRGEYGPIITSVIYILVFVQNALRWSREYIVDERDIPKGQRTLRRFGNHPNEETNEEAL